jgi:hypothetical protein
LIHQRGGGGKIVEEIWSHSEIFLHKYQTGSFEALEEQL